MALWQRCSILRTANYHINAKPDLNLDPNPNHDLNPNSNFSS